MPDNKTQAGVKPVEQDRSAATRERIYAALAKAADIGSLETHTVTDIVSVAECSVGAFYGRFESKEAAIAGLYAVRRENFLSRFGAASQRAASLDDWARSAARAALDHAAANRALIACLAETAPAATLFAEVRVADAGLIGLVSRLFRERFGLKMTPDEAAGASSFALALIGGMARDAAVHSSTLLSAAKTEAWFVDALAAAVASYVRGCAAKQSA